MLCLVSHVRIASLLLSILKAALSDPAAMLVTVEAARVFSYPLTTWL